MPTAKHAPARRRAGLRIGKAAAPILTCLAFVAVLPAYAGQALPVLDMLAGLLPLAVPAGIAALLAALATGRWRWAVLAAVILCLAAGRLLPEWLGAPSGAEAGTGGRTIRVLSHNLHGGGSVPARQVRALAQSGADILLLQENKVASARALDALAPLYPYRDRCGACETAILSRLPMDEVRWRLPGPDGRATGPALFRAVVHVAPGVDVTVISLHAPRATHVEEHNAYLKSLARALLPHIGPRMILAGDFNEVPWSAAMRQLEHDIRPLRRVTRATFSYPALIDEREWPLPLLPIDHMFVGSGIAVRSVRLLPSTGSDHLPILAQLVLGPGDAR